MKIQQLIFSLSVRKVNDKLIKFSDFVLTQLFIDDIDVVDKFITTTIIVEVHLIDDLKTNMLIDVDVFKSQKMILNFEHNTLIINNCDITTTINSVNREKSHVKRIIRNQKIFTMLLDELIKISVIFYDDLSNDKNFLFESQCTTYLNQNENVFAHIIDSNLFFIQIHNITIESITLTKRARLKSIMKYNQQKCYQITMNEAFKVVCDWMFKRFIKNSWKIKIIKVVAIITIVCAITIDNSSFKIDDNSSFRINNFSAIDLSSLNIDIFVNVSMIIDIFQIDSTLKHICFNDVIVYDSSNAIDSIVVLMKKYQNLFVDKNITMNISKKKMNVY